MLRASKATVAAILTAAVLAVTHAGHGAPVIGAARVALDFDGDGYTYLLGGGDCNDRAPAAREMDLFRG
jgi:hypothetical protein